MRRRNTHEPVCYHVRHNAHHDHDSDERRLRCHADRDDRTLPSRADFFRSDIRETRAGTVLTLTINVVNVNNACAAVPNADVEIWHVDAAGDYSQYGSQTAATFLRGIQTTNASGEVTFTTIYPGWYQGRATHIHAEVSVNGRSIKATQIAFTEVTNNAVHTSGVYASRGTNPMSNLSEGIFADSLSSELVAPGGRDGLQGSSPGCRQRRPQEPALPPGNVAKKAAAITATATVTNAITRGRMRPEFIRTPAH
jgi:hypothetical protein